jgi:hypothetical protein
MRTAIRVKLAIAIAGAALLVSPGVVLAAEAPVKEIVSSRIGSNVNKKQVEEGASQTERNLCTVASKDECQFGAQSTEPGGFQYPEGIAVDNATALVSPEHGDVYVADTGNDRVEVFSPTGALLFTFGTKGEAAGQFESPASVTVDPATGNVYVEDFLNWRVQEFTATGEFVLMIGKDVNATTKGNLCTAESKDKCTAGERAPENSTELGAFDFEESSGGLLTVGGPEGLLYVGDWHRVERFKTDGIPTDEIPLRSISAEPGSTVDALTVDQAGNIYVAYKVSAVSDNVIYEFDPTGKELERIELAPRRPEAASLELEIKALALDPAGRLAVSERERGTVDGQDFTAVRGGVYEIGTSGLHLLTEFDDEFPTEFEALQYAAASLVFNGEDDAYAVGGDEVVTYVPVRVAALSAKPAVCNPGTDSETDVTIECELKGEANPWGVPQTRAWFQWGTTPALGSATTPEPVATGEVPVETNGALTGLLPNETYYDRLVAEDENVKAPELLTSEATSVRTPTVAPRIVGEPSTLHVGPFSVVMFGELNPENANTTYRFQYGPCEALEGCPGVAETEAAQSPTYGAIGTTAEASGLLPATAYHYRLLASNEQEIAGKHVGGRAVSAEGSFTTAPGPVVAAETGSASAVGSTSAVVSGSVNPDGQAAAYTFELGLYTGAGTQLGVVYSGPAGAGATPVGESLALSGLQPGTTYVYRIAVHSGDGSAKGASATGATLTFTTEGRPAVLSIPTTLAMLGIPDVAFPTGPAAAKAAPQRLTRAQHLANALKACRQKPKKRRAGCERTARRKYAASQTKGKRK